MRNNLSINWQQLANACCYADEKTMLIDLYYQRGLTTEDIGNKLGVDSASVRDEMDKLNLPRRPKGGCTKRYETKEEHKARINKIFKEITNGVAAPIQRPNLES